MPHVIQIQSVDWLCRDNGAVHHTDRLIKSFLIKYPLYLIVVQLPCPSRFELVQERKSCVVRRGFDVRLSLLCRPGGRMFDANRDRIRLVFEFGKRPNVTKGTRAVAELRVGGPAVLGRPWQALFIKKEGASRVRYS